MQLERLDLWNFRGIRHLSLDLHPRLTILVGGNGAGKTSLLDALSIGLSHYVARLTKSAGSARRMSKDDIKVGTPEAKIQIEAKDGDTKISWSVVKQGQRERIVRPRSSDYRPLIDFVNSIAERQLDDSRYLIGETPIIYYDQRRSMLDIPQRKRGNISHNIVDAFAESLVQGKLDFRKLTYWFQERETEELRLQRKDHSYKDSQLDAVRTAITTSTGLEDPYYRIESPRGLAFHKGKVELHTSQLSTGEKVYMALAADLSRRLAIINPSLNNPLQGCAIVLIDEIELHLHPEWQRKIVTWLTTTFENCQFILTTHSPQVLGDVRADNIRVLNTKDGEVKLGSVRASYGRDSNYLLTAAFGVDERPSNVKRRIESIDSALSENRLEDAKKEIKNLRNDVEGGDPQVDIAEARLARRTKLHEL